MGNNTSKKSKETITKTHKTELKSYEAACKEDTEMQSFDKCLQARTRQVISTLATGVDVGTLSLDSLKEVTECFLEMNQDVVKMILNCEKDIWEHDPLFELVKDYLDTSMKTLDFYDALKRCLNRAGLSHYTITLALHYFEEESFVQGGNGYEKTLKELKNFKDVKGPFNEDFFKMFQSVYKQQMLMLEKLQLHKKKLAKNFKRFHTWQKLYGVIFVATLATALICSVVAASIAAPPVAAALAAATALPLGPMGKWMDSIWKNYENAVKGHKEVISSMQAGTFVAVKDLDDIRNLIGKLETEIRGIVSAEFAVEHDEMRIGIDVIRKKLEVFDMTVEKLRIQADLCSTDIVQARTVVLQRFSNA